METKSQTIGILHISNMQNENYHLNQMGRRQLAEKIEFYGHPNILGTHGNTIEVTKVGEITKRADCIIGVNASKACSDLSPSLKKHIQNGGHLALEIKVEDIDFRFTGRGRSELNLLDSHELVLRRSDFVSDRTAAISCDAAAIDLPRKMIKLLQDGRVMGTLTIAPLEIYTTSEELSVPLFIES